MVHNIRPNVKYCDSGQVVSEMIEKAECISVYYKLSFSSGELTKANVTKSISDGLCVLSFEPPCGKTNNVVSELVQHKPACTATEAG